MKYLLENPVKGSIGTEKYRTVIEWRNGAFITDEPEKLGGRDLGPDPYSLLMASLVSCTLATLRMYIERKELDIPEIRVEANLYLRITKDETKTHIERKIDFGNAKPEPEILESLLSIAEKCPISVILKSNAEIQTEIV